MHEFTKIIHGSIAILLNNSYEYQSYKQVEFDFIQYPFLLDARINCGVYPFIAYARTKLGEYY